MRVREVAERINLIPLTENCGLEREVQGAYCGDLLSWVMSHGRANNIWVTVQVHPNVVAVAVLVEFPCIIIPDEIEVENITLEKAKQENIAILQSKDNAFEICGKLKAEGV